MKRAVLLVAVTGCLSTPSPPEGRGRVWRELPNADQPGALHSPRMTFDRDRKTIVMHGGVTTDGPVNTTWELSENYEWGEICKSTTLPALYSPAFAYDRLRSRLVLVGGSLTPDFRTPITTVWTCSTATAGSTWVEVTSMPAPVALVGAQLVDDDDRGLVLVGGNDNEANYSTRAYATLDVDTGWAPVADATPAALGGASTNVTYDDHNDRILALKNITKPFEQSGEATDELWQLSRSGRWSLVCGPCLPRGRTESVLVHLGESSSTFMIGGFDNSTRNEIAGSWILDNQELVRTHDDPPARDRAAAAYNRDRQEVIVYGGNGAGCGGNCGSTWLLELEPK